MMLLTFGVDSVSLWHLFDPEISSETVSRYRELTQNLVSDTRSPINYQSWLLPEIKSIPSSTDEKEMMMVQILNNLNKTSFLLSATYSLKSNPLLNRWDTKIMRSIIKQGYRMVYK